MLVHPKAAAAQDALRHRSIRACAAEECCCSSIRTRARTPAAKIRPIRSRRAMANHSSDLEPLLAAWGVDYDPTKVIGDLERGLEVRTSMQSPPVRHIGILGLRPRRHESEGRGHGVARVDQSRHGRLARRTAGRQDHIRAAAAEFRERGAASRAALQRAHRSGDPARWIQADRHSLCACGAHHRTRRIPPTRKGAAGSEAGRRARRSRILAKIDACPPISSSSPTPTC